MITNALKCEFESFYMVPMHFIYAIKLVKSSNSLQIYLLLIYKHSLKRNGVDLQPISRAYLCYNLGSPWPKMFAKSTFGA